MPKRTSKAGPMTALEEISAACQNVMAAAKERYPQNMLAGANLVIDLPMEMGETRLSLILRTTNQRYTGWGRSPLEAAADLQRKFNANHLVIPDRPQRIASEAKAPELEEASLAARGSTA